MQGLGIKYMTKEEMLVISWEYLERRETHRYELTTG